MPLDSEKPAGFDRLKAVADGLKQQISHKRSLNVAKKRQRYMLPRLPRVAGYDFAFSYNPAEHLSGDFCDVIDLGEGRYGVLVGDISGHGMEAALVMGAARKALQIYARLAENPIRALALANDDLRRDLDRETFLTVSYAVLDTRTGRCQYVRAGHNRPLLVGPDPGQWQEIRSGGASLGLAEGEQFRRTLQEVELEIKPGQTFLQFTDGVVEAHGPRSEEFGVERFVAYLERHARAGRSLAETLESLPVELDAWTGSAAQEDDITVLAVRCL